MNQKLHYEAPLSELITIATAGILLGSLTGNSTQQSLGIQGWSDTEQDW